MTNHFQGLAMRATPDDVKSASSDIYVSTVGPGDMVYIPPGALISVQVHEPLANSDFFKAPCHIPRPAYTPCRHPRFIPNQFQDHPQAQT